jgi:ubiquitin C-terminal hydrolase
LFYVLKQKRKYHDTESWQPVSLYDNENHFRGEAIFETEKDAEEYMKIYSDRLANKRNEQNKSNNYVSKTSVQLKIFEENEKLKTDFLPLYRRKQPVL